MYVTLFSEKENIYYFQHLPNGIDRDQLTNEPTLTTKLKSFTFLHLH